MDSQSVDSVNAPRCQRCGDAFRDEATQGHCPACLLELAAFGDLPSENSELSHRLGDYELLQEIARGGMGIVFKARQISLNRMVAVKMMLNGHLSNSEANERFMREATAAANLDHPNIVPIYEVSEADAERFFAMKLISGKSLAERLPELQLHSDANQQRTIARLMLKVARALAYAHEHGVLHRDLKPSNILLDESGEPILTDFGLAKLEDEDNRLTLTTAVLGSPSYMAPEQAQGGIRDVTTAADVYGVGAILFEMLTGKPPFEGATPVDTLQKVIHEEPLSLRESQSLVDRDLETLCLKCLEKDPARRYPSMNALADEFERYLLGEPILARPVSKLEMSWRWCRRNPAMAALGAAAVISTIAGITGVLWQWQEAKAARATAETERDEARWETYQAKLSAASSAAQLHETVALRKSLSSAPKEHRNWEWFYFDSLLKPSYRTLTPMRGFPSDLAFDAEEQRIAEKFFPADPSQGTNVITVWEIANGQPWWELPPESNLTINLSAVSHLGSNGTLTLSHPATKEPILTHRYQADDVPRFLGSTTSNDHILTISDHTMSLWNVITKSRVDMPFRTEVGSPRTVVAINDGSQFVFLNDTAHVVYDATTGEKIAHYPSHSLSRVIKADPNNDVAAIGGLYPNNSITLLDLASGQSIGRFTGHANDTVCLDFSRTGEHLVSGSVDKTVRVWDVKTQREIAWMSGHRGDVTRVAFSPDGKTVASCGSDHTVRLWNSLTGQPKEVLLGHQAEPVYVLFSPSGKLLASADTNEIKLWDMEKKPSWLHGHSSYVYDVGFSPDGKHIASVSWDETARIWDIHSGGPLRRIALGEIGLGVAYSPDGRFLAASTLRSLRWWDLENGDRVIEKRYDIGETARNKLTPAFHPNSKQVALGLRGKISIWDTETGSELNELLLKPNQYVADVDYNKQGTLIISCAGNQIQVWDLPTSTITATMTHDSKVESISVSPDGKFIASAGAGDGVSLWASDSRQKLATFDHQCRVYSTVFSHDTTRLFTAGEDGVIRIWDLTHFQQVGSLHGHSRYVHSLAFSPDAHTLVSCSGDHSVKLWIAD